MVLRRKYLSVYAEIEQEAQTMVQKYKMMDEED